ncbi:MAG TPA: hypothetical protein VFI57_08470 [Pyrinomonadaceae bacterium]|nr:hypothetical protein [Pyrinomonadaceae bacterium]
MSRIRWFALLALAAFLLNVGPLEAQESKVTPGRRVTYPSYEVDVLVDGRPLPECEGRGGIYVEARRGEEYEIRLRNRSNDRVAVALYVDGLNTIDSSRTSPSDASKWMIEPYQTITISGWQMDSDHARRFYFTSERDSYAAKLGVYGSRGVILAAFYRERRRRPIPITPPRPMPRRGDREESQSSADMRPSAEGPTVGTANKSRARDEAATGIGRSVRHDVEYIDMDLESRPAAEVKIRYDYGSISESNPKYRVRGKRDN